MSMHDNHQLMDTLFLELSLVRGLGREGGIRAMDLAVEQLTELVEKMFHEGD